LFRAAAAFRRQATAKRRAARCAAFCLPNILSGRWHYWLPLGTPYRGHGACLVPRYANWFFQRQGDQYGEKRPANKH
jgi:hypothetical protein